MEFILFLKNIDTISYITIFTLIMICIGLYIKRKSPFIKEIVENAIIEAEKKFNSGEGQEKLKYATERVRERVPIIFKIFITHRMTVTIIESTLNKISHTFDIDRKIDIIGNENIVSKKIEIDKDTRSTSFEVNMNKGSVSEDDKSSDTELYASLKAKTDWRENTETSLEVGFKKKF
ncbi:MAG: hypothetical protein ACRC1T_09255 [Clostridium chrysemydis]|uniref:hypothetical protein n=1 Tax=Clostridium chrysemydis TaxID=2665504 RepID=UPI003F2EF58D